MRKGELVMKTLRLMDYFAELKSLLLDKGTRLCDAELTRLAVLYRNAGYTPAEAAELEGEELG
jgi:hypothetical protein